MPEFISIDRRYQKLADNGDVDAVWQLLTNSAPGQIDYSEGFQLLLRAVEVRAGQAPAAFADELFKRILSFSGYLLLRSHLQLSKLMVTHDRQMQQRGREDPSEELAGLLPSLIELQRHVVEVAQAHAAMHRLRQLAEQKRLENKHLDGTGCSRSPRRRAAKAILMNSNGKAPRNRLRGLLADRQ